MLKTQKYQNPLQGAHKKELTFSFDNSAEDPVNKTFAAGGFWSKEMAAFCSLFWRGNCNILDVGANISAFSTLAASFTKGKVFSIEPDPANFEYILKNKADNGFDNQFCHNVAASDSEGELDFCMAGPGGHVSAPGWGNEVVKVSSVPLDNFFKDTKVDFIKLDVEGYELKALAGLRETIKRDMPPICVEINGFTLMKCVLKTPNDLIRDLEERGYRVFVMSDRLVPVNYFEGFPYGVVDCLALADHHLSAVGNQISLGLSYWQRKIKMQQSAFEGNSDMQEYFSWYRPKFGI